MNHLTEEEKQILANLNKYNKSNGSLSIKRTSEVFFDNGTPNTILIKNFVFDIDKLEKSFENSNCNDLTPALIYGFVLKDYIISLDVINYIENKWKIKIKIGSWEIKNGRTSGLVYGIIVPREFDIRLMVNMAFGGDDKYFSEKNSDNIDYCNLIEEQSYINDNNIRKSIKELVSLVKDYFITQDKFFNLSSVMQDINYHVAILGKPINIGLKTLDIKIPKR